MRVLGINAVIHDPAVAPVPDPEDVSVRLAAPMRGCAVLVLDARGEVVSPPARRCHRDGGLEVRLSQELTHSSGMLGASTTESLGPALLGRARAHGAADPWRATSPAVLRSAGRVAGAGRFATESCHKPS